MAIRIDDDRQLEASVERLGPTLTPPQRTTTAAARVLLWESIRRHEADRGLRPLVLDEAGQAVPAAEIVGRTDRPAPDAMTT